MDFNSVKSIKAAGFQGFATVEHLWKTRHEKVPQKPGIYLILRNTSSGPAFLKKSVAGLYKRKSFTEPISLLKEKWVENTIVVYIGKAGGEGIEQTLKERLGKYVDTRFAKVAKRKGGKLIWQLADSADLVVCWKTRLNTKNPVEAEEALKAKFREKFGKLPFANRR
jgi:hypothetical protein